MFFFFYIYIDFGPTKSDANYNLYFYKEIDFILVVLIYIDDLVIIENHTIRITKLKRKLENKFKMSKIEFLIF